MNSGMKINLLTLAGLAIVLIVVAPHLHQLNWTPARIAGAAIMAVSLVAVVAARFQLGAAFSVTAKARKLVTTGIYAKVRNPIYVFGEFFLLGVTLLSGRRIFLLIGVALIPLQMRRARNEARVLRAAFGEEYDRWRAQTWF